MQLNIEGLDEHIATVAEAKIAEALAARDGKVWYTAVEAADYLGLAVSTIHDYVNDGKLPRHGAKGTRLRFTRDDLDGLASNGLHA
jgi:excisionase family DNA binding protein